MNLYVLCGDCEGERLITDGDLISRCPRCDARGYLPYDHGTLYRRVFKLKKKCWHTGSYASHDEGCHEICYEQVTE